MDGRAKICIITPTYNRLETLKRLYASLLLQTSKEFVWLVVDDGSSDGTPAWFEGVDFSNSGFPVRYHRKRNGGKHTALNYAHEFIQEEYVVIVDSDDELTPDAVETMLDMWDVYAKDATVAGITLQRGKRQDGEAFDQRFLGMRRSTYSAEVNSGMRGDHCETFRADRFLAFDFPVFPGERFVAEGAMWFLITKGFATVYSDKVVYICEYLEGGLTKRGRQLRLANPRGGMWHANVMTDSMFRLSIRMKNTLLFDCYAVLARCSIREAMQIAQHKLPMICLWPFGFLLGVYWRRKHAA